MEDIIKIIATLMPIFTLILTAYINRNKKYRNYMGLKPFKEETLSIMFRTVTLFTVPTAIVITLGIHQMFIALFKLFIVANDTIGLDKYEAGITAFSAVPIIIIATATLWIFIDMVKKFHEKGKNVLTPILLSQLIFFVVPTVIIRVIFSIISTNLVNTITLVFIGYLIFGALVGYFNIYRFYIEKFVSINFYKNIHHVNIFNQHENKIETIKCDTIYYNKDYIMLTIKNGNNQIIKKHNYSDVVSINTDVINLTNQGKSLLNNPN